MTKREKNISHEFVEYIPSDIQEGKLYISIPYATAIHKCFCGCGREIITPFTPTDWSLIFDGQSISLDPSIGNWSFDCKSHYWIKRNKVLWAETWSKERINKGRVFDQLTKDIFFDQTKSTALSDIATETNKHKERKSETSFWSRFKKSIKQL